MRSTAVTSAAWQPVWSAKLGICGWKPWPHSHTWLAWRPNWPTISRLASMTAWSLAAAGPGGPHRGLVGQVVRRRAVGVGPVGRCHQDVAVLHAGVELDVGTDARAELRVERLDDLGGLLGGGVTAGEVEHRAVVADRREVAAVGHPVGAELAGRGRPPRSAPARCGSGPGRTRGSTCCRRRCPAACPAG